MVFTICLCGCKEKQTLHIYSWADYIDPSIVEQFEKENDCKVIIDTFDSNETLFAKLMAGASGYDICCPTEYIIPLLKNVDMIDKIDISKVPNVVKNFDSRFTNQFDRLEWHIPYAFSCTGILYRKDKFPNKTFKTWNDMFSDEFQHKICMFDDIREVLGVALKENGYSINSTNLKELLIAVKTARTWKSKVRKMDNEAYRFGIASGEFNIAMGYNSDAIQLLFEKPDEIGFVVPECGTTSCVDSFVIMKESQNKELAYKFLNFLYERNNAIKNCEYICSPMIISNLHADLSEEYQKNEFMSISDDLLNKCENIKDLGEHFELYNTMWDHVKKIHD